MVGGVSMKVLFCSFLLLHKTSYQIKNQEDLDYERYYIHCNKQNSKGMGYKGNADLVRVLLPVDLGNYRRLQINLHKQYAPWRTEMI